MKKKMCMAIAVIVLLVGIPASGFSALIYSDEFDATGVYVNFLDFGNVSEGSYLLTIDDISGVEPGFLGLVFLFNTGTNNFFDNILYLNQAQTHDNLSFDLDGESTLSATIFGLTNLNTDSYFTASSVPPSFFETSSFSVQLSSVPVPATLLLLGSGLFALTALKRRKLQ